MAPPDRTALLQEVARLANSRQPAEALRLLEPAAWPSEDAELWHTLGLLYHHLGKADIAVAALRRACRWAPDHAVYLGNLVHLLLNQGLPFSAQRALETAGAQGAPEAIWQPRLQQLRAAHPARRVTMYTPGYGCADTIERCLRSIMAQTYPVHEIVVVDDKAADRSTAIALEMGVKVYYHQENLGLAASCNTALQHCTGDFLAKIDTDLELSLTWLERLMPHFANDRVGGVGGRLIEFRTATVPDQWRRIYMKQHYGPQVVVDPPGLFGADCLFRVDALRHVNGWDPRYRTNFEDMDLSRRLKGAGFQLVYEPNGHARHLRQDSLHDVIRNFWNWYADVPQDQGFYNSLANVARLVPRNRQLSLERFGDTLNRGTFRLAYPSFLLYFWQCLRDLQQVHRRGQADRDVVNATQLGVVLTLRHQLRNLWVIPSRVSGRTLADLQALLRNFLTDADRALLGDDDELEKRAPSHLRSVEALLGSIVHALPTADRGYLEAFAREPFLTQFAPWHGQLLDTSVQALAADEREHGPAQRDRPAAVIFHPPLERGGDPNPQEDGPARLFDRARAEAFAEKLRCEGQRVLILDAVSEGLDELEAHERVLGLEPQTVYYLGAPKLIAASAKRMKHLAKPCPRLACLDEVSSKDLPMIDEFEHGLEPR